MRAAMLQASYIVLISVFRYISKSLLYVNLHLSVASAIFLDVLIWVESVFV